MDVWPIKLHRLDDDHCMHTQGWPNGLV
jgi:hypothetical protein